MGTPPPLARDPCTWLLAGAYLLFFTLLCPISHPPFDVHDEGGKLVYLTSVVLDGDLDFVNQRRGYNLALGITPTGYSYQQWVIGPAMLWAPFYLLAHAVDPGAGEGYAALYLTSVALGTVCWGWFGLLLLYDLLRRLYGRAAGGLAALLACFASQIPHFLFARPIHDHGLTFSCVCLTLWAFQRLREDPSRASSWALLGAATGLSMTMRPDTPVLFLCVAVACLPLLRQAARAPAGPVLLLAAAALFYAPQPLANRVIWDRWIGSSGDANHSMDDFSRSSHPGILLEPGRWAILLFNPMGGLLLVSPVFAFALAGLLVRVRRDPIATLGWLLYPLLLLFGLMALTDAHHSRSWLLYRYFSNAAPILGLGTAELLSRLGGRRSGGFRAAVVLGALAVAWQALQSQQVENRLFHDQPDLLPRILHDLPALISSGSWGAFGTPKSLASGPVGASVLAAVLLLLAWTLAWPRLLDAFRRLDPVSSGRGTWTLLLAAGLALAPLLWIELRQPRKTDREIYQAARQRLRLSLEDRWGHVHDLALLEKSRELGSRLGEDLRELTAIEGFVRFRRGERDRAEGLWLEALARGEDRLALAGMAQISALRGDAAARDAYRKRFETAPPDPSP